MGAATRREARERGESKLYAEARKAGFTVSEHVVPDRGRQLSELQRIRYYVDPIGAGPFMNWRTATMSAISYVQLRDPIARDKFMELTSNGWSAGEALREVRKRAARGTLAAAKSVVSSSEYHAAGVKQRQKAEARQKRAFARVGMASDESIFGRVGSTAEAYKRIIMAEPRGTANDAIHARVVKELGAKKAGPLSYVAWYRRWLVKHGYPTAAK